MGIKKIGSRFSLSIKRSLFLDRLMLRENLSQLEGKRENNKWECALYGQAFAVFLFPIKLYSSFLGAFSFTLDHRNAMNCYALILLSLSLSFFFYYISILEDKIQVLKFSRKNVWIKLLSQYCYLSLLYSKIQNTRNNLTTNKTWNSKILFHVSFQKYTYLRIVWIQVFILLFYQK